VKRPKPKRLTVTIVSEPPGLVDLEVVVERGGCLNLSLGDGKEDDGPGALSLPGGLRDQRKWISDKDGLRPVLQGEQS
jgi:hypothetical protein